MTEEFTVTQTHVQSAISGAFCPVGFQQQNFALEQSSTQWAFTKACWSPQTGVHWTNLALLNSGPGQVVRGTVKPLDSSYNTTLVAAGGAFIASSFAVGLSPFAAGFLLGFGIGSALSGVVCQGFDCLPPLPPPPTGGSTGPDGRTCFAAGTTVQGEQGPKDIENIRTGDLVWSHDDVTGKVGLRRVARTFVTLGQPLVEISIETSDGRSEKLKATPEHPFRVNDRGWVKAMNLQPGDNVFPLDGKPLRVSSVAPLEGVHTVYNFEVEEFHTYYVGEFHSLVHNSCGPDFADHAPKRRPFAGRRR